MERTRLKSVHSKSSKYHVHSMLWAIPPHFKCLEKDGSVGTVDAVKA